MSNESNREASRTISPSDLQASDFFPPGTGWNRDESPTPKTSREHERQEDQDSATDGRRQH